MGPTNKAPATTVFATQRDAAAATTAAAATAGSKPSIKKIRWYKPRHFVWSTDAFASSPSSTRAEPTAQLTVPEVQGNTPSPITCPIVEITHGLDLGHLLGISEVSEP